MYTYSNEEYLRFKEHAIENAPIRNQVSLCDLKIVNESVIEYRGTPIELQRGAFDALLKNLNISKNLLKKFKINLGESQSYSFLNAIRQATSNSNKNIVLVADVKSKQITNFLSPKQTVVSNTLFFEIFERIVERYTGLELRELHFGVKDGVSISTTNARWEFGIQGLADEKFNSGINFKNDFRDGLLISPFNERLACTNGMIFNRDSKTIHLNNIDKKTLTNFMQEVFNPERFRLYEDLFINRVKRMCNINCSFAELNDAYLTVKSMLNHCPTPDMVLNPEIPIHDVIADYKLHGIDVNKLDINFQKNARTPVKFWDLLNTLTYHASHKSSELQLIDRDRLFLQEYAGRLAMKKSYDTEALIRDIYAK